MNSKLFRLPDIFLNSLMSLLLQIYMCTIIKRVVNALILLQAIQNENVLVGYKAFSSSDEEFLICTTDRARQFIEHTQIQVERELKQRNERSMFRVPGPWESKSSEKDIEDIKSVPAREKVNIYVIYFIRHILHLTHFVK